MPRCVSGGTGGLSDTVAFEANSGKGVAVADFFQNWDNGTHSLAFWRNTAIASKVSPSAVTGTTYYDATGVYAQSYYYWVKAVNAGGTSAFSVPGTGYRGNLPTISTVADQTVNQDSSTAALAFTVNGNETPAASLTLSAASSNPALIPATNLAFGGSGASRTATIALTVADADGGEPAPLFC